MRGGGGLTPAKTGLAEASAGGIRHGHHGGFAGTEPGGIILFYIGKADA